MISVHFGLRKNSAGCFRIFHCFKIAVSQYMELEWQATSGIFLSFFSLKLGFNLGYQPSNQESVTGVGEPYCFVREKMLQCLPEWEEN